jgi:hypothetical protein
MAVTQNRPRVQIGSIRLTSHVEASRLAMCENHVYAGAFATQHDWTSPKRFSDKEEVPGSSPGSPISRSPVDTAIRASDGWGFVAGKHVWKRHGSPPLGSSSGLQSLRRAWIAAQMACGAHQTGQAHGLFDLRVAGIPSAGVSLFVERCARTLGTSSSRPVSLMLWTPTRSRRPSRAARAFPPRSTRANSPTHAISTRAKPAITAATRSACAMSLLLR